MSYHSEIGTDGQLAFEYWKRIDSDIGKRIEENVRLGSAPAPLSGMGES